LADQTVKDGVKKFLIPFLVVDVLFLAALGFWLIHGRIRAAAGEPDIQVQLRHPESKLTEIDLINDGNAAGPVNVSIDVSWPDADLVDAKGLSRYDQTDTGRRSLRLSPQASGSGVTLAPGETCAVGWVKLTDDVPVRAEIATDSGSATQP
jgi:hypothetical protein